MSNPKVSLNDRDNLIGLFITYHYSTIRQQQQQQQQQKERKKVTLSIHIHIHIFYY